MSKGRYFGVLIPNLDGFWITPTGGRTGGVGGGRDGEKVTFMIFRKYHHVKVGFWGC